VSEGPIAPAGGAPRKRRALLVVVIVLCAVLVLSVPCLCVFSAIFIPNFVHAVERGKQKRTLADIRAIGGAMELYARDSGRYPEVEDLESLRARLEPDFIKKMPMRDGWGHPLEVRSDGAEYVIVSPGKNGELDGCSGGATSTADADICFANGSFQQYPDGTTP